MTEIRRMTDIDSLSKELHGIAIQKGFYDTLDMAKFESQAKQLAMIHSEVSEVLEALRKSQGSQKVVEELADILIRVFDFYAALVNAGVVHESLIGSLMDKTAVNKERPRMHGVKG